MVDTIPQRRVVGGGDVVGCNGVCDLMREPEPRSWNHWSAGKKVPLQGIQRAGTLHDMASSARLGGELEFRADRYERRSRQVYEGGGILRRVLKSIVDPI